MRQSQKAKRTEETPSVAGGGAAVESSGEMAAAGAKTERATMQAAVIQRPGVVEVRQVAVPEVEAGRVRVKLKGCGVCGSNLPPWEGRDWFEYPMPPGHLGHEGWGLIDEVGADVSGLEAGQLVAFLSDGAYAEYDVTEAEKVVPLPPELADMPFPAEPLGCAVNVYRRSGIKQGDTVAVVGTGFLGSLLVQLASAAGARVLAISRRSFALEMARQCGAAETIAMDDHWRIIEQVRELTEGRLCDVVIEAVGRQWPLDLAGELCRERGRLVVAGYHQDGPRTVNMQMWNWRGLDVINAHERDVAVYVAGIREAIAAVLAGRLEPWPLMTHRYGLSELGEALDATRDRPDGFMKALIIMDG